MGLGGIKFCEYISKCGQRLIETKPHASHLSLKYVSPPQATSIGLSKSMTVEEAKVLMKNTGLRTFSARDTQVAMKINNRDVVGYWLEGGGSKCAYRVNLDGEEVCILLPHNNWYAAMNEPKNTLILKNLGLVTNDYCKILPVEVDGKTIPALVSKPYDRHLFKIFDKKNPNDDLDKYFDIGKIREDNLEEVFGSLVKDVKTLVDNDIRLAYDSFNLALKDGKLRLYLNDLPYDNIIKNGNKKDKLRLYMEYMLETVPASVNWLKIKNYPFADSLNSIEGQDKILPKLFELYNKL